MYTRQQVAFQKTAEPEVERFHIEWLDNYENCYDDTEPYQDAEGNQTCYGCRDCFEDWTEAQLVVTDPQTDNQLYAQADIGARCNNG